MAGPLLRKRNLAAALLLLAGACGQASTPPPAPPASALPGLQVVRTSELDADSLVADAVDEATLATLLDELEPESAVERWFTGGPALRRVQVRVVRFDDAQRAERYLRWLRTNVEDVIGSAEVAAALKVPASTSVFIHEPNPCCPKETSVAFAAWRDGADVIRVLAAGPTADVDTATELIVGVHRWYGTAS